MRDIRFNQIKRKCAQQREQKNENPKKISYYFSVVKLRQMCHLIEFYEFEWMGERQVVLLQGPLNAKKFTLTKSEHKYIRFGA